MEAVLLTVSNDVVAVIRKGSKLDESSYWHWAVFEGQKMLAKQFKTKTKVKKIKIKPNIIKPMPKNRRHMSEQKVKMKIGKVWTLKITW